MIAAITMVATIILYQPKATLVAGNFAHIQRCYEFRHILLISGPEMTIIIFVIMTLADDNDDRCDHDGSHYKFVSAQGHSIGWELKFIAIYCQCHHILALVTNMSAIAIVIMF